MSRWPSGLSVGLRRVETTQRDSVGWFFYVRIHSSAEPYLRDRALLASGFVGAHALSHGVCLGAVVA